jgi:hypothetical protein
VTVYFEVQSKLIIMTFTIIKLRLHWVFLNDINCCPKFHAPNSTHRSHTGFKLGAKQLNIVKIGCKTTQHFWIQS